MKEYLVGLDIGGSHVAGTRVRPHELASGPLVNKPINSTAGAGEIISSVADLIKELTRDLDGRISVGIAMPGPFNYPQGIFEIHGVGGKFGNCFGLHFGEALKTFTGLDKRARFYFFNDAQCFAQGAYRHFALADQNVICITLGTGFGSTFIINGAITGKHENIPASGMFYNEPFKNALADDYFSSRWFLQAYKHATGEAISSVKKLAELAKTDPRALHIFEEFGKNLASFLAPWINRSKSTALIAGGNLTKTWELFGGSFKQHLSGSGADITVHVCHHTEQLIIEGAAFLAQQTKNQMEEQKIRKTSQPILPLKRPATRNSGGYEIFPAFKIKEGTVLTGFETLARELSTEKTVIIDGFGGVIWDNFRENLNMHLDKLGVKPLWFDIRACLKTEDTINTMITGSLNGDDPVFGKRFTGNIQDFFDEYKLNLISPDEDAGMNIVYGTGAALCGWIGKLIYLDLPKNEIQYRMRARSIYNLGSATHYENTQMYKRFYFVDWPVLNEHKKNLLPEIDVIIDEQRVSEISWMHGKDLRTALDQVLKHAFRARPWFEAGVWGGQWMKEKLTGLYQEEINYAWSFELITPENGIVLEQNENLLEISFDFLLYHDNVKVLGKAADRFGYEFPIRFDFLDTFDGGNLSIQCHPRTDYIREHFGETFTQDETYYILDCKPGAEVFLGFQDDIDPEKFRAGLEDAQHNGTELNVREYVQTFPANKHDLFLIPNGTIHASGMNNMVLEISSTPYIFTFKMYDWQRLDLTGKPRPINIGHAFNNLDFDRKGKWVADHLVSKPELIERTGRMSRYLLPTHPEHFYRIERYEFSGEVSITTNGQCHIGMLVEGRAIDIATDDLVQTFHYAETFVIPAAAAEYKLINTGPQTARVVIASVKDE